ncbi:unnamed protein product [Triticum turgidum subsp. durum]|uniref:K Homology domain-containing protein n=1 Tax=Triticum turgidum subsp. durum TaxID=4567 RepID=A0A9R0RUM5_TRITD|nr:unnamed protein product [Triticum turgidum subsp. durum]
MGVLQASPMSWNGAPALGGTPVVKKLVRLDVPVDKYPNFNFVGRLLGPRGNSLKRVEATTQCRVYIRGRGSVKDSVKVTKHTIMYCSPVPDFSSAKPLDSFRMYTMCYCHSSSCGINLRDFFPG